MSIRQDHPIKFTPLVYAPRTIKLGENNARARGSWYQHRLVVPNTVRSVPAIILLQWKPSGNSCSGSNYADRQQGADTIRAQILLGPRKEIHDMPTAKMDLVAREISLQMGSPLHVHLSELFRRFLQKRPVASSSHLDPSYHGAQGRQPDRKSHRNHTLV